MEQSSVHHPQMSIPAKRPLSQCHEETLVSAKRSVRPNQRNGNGNGTVPDFIQKLFRMLDNMAFQNTFCWGEDGTTFIVKDTNEFSKTILPKHFKHCNFASFVRQLNKYDFHKVRHADDGQKPFGDQAWEFVHPKFKRDREDLLDEIRRKAPGKSKKEEPSDPTRSDVSSTSSERHSTPSADSLEEMKRITQSLQAQIDALSKSQKEMEASIQRLDQTDNLILGELSKLASAMSAKDKLVQDFLQLSAQNKGLHETHDPNLLSTKQPGTFYDSQQLLDSYMEIAQSNNNLINTIAKHLKGSQNTEGWNAFSMEAPKPALIPEPPPVRTQTDCNITQFPTTFHDQSTVADISQSTNTLVDSSLKAGDSIAFLKMGRVPGSTQVARGQPSSSSGLSLWKKSDKIGWSVPPRVLLVDDDSIFRDISGRLLQVIGCTIDSAKDGVEALRKMGLEKYDLILMDIVMPNLDGITATRSIRQYDASTPIISMTSNFSESDIIQYVGSGMTDILPKPFTKNTLYDMLEKYCAHLKVIQRLEPSSVPRGLGSFGPALAIEAPQITEIPITQPPQQPQQTQQLPHAVASTSAAVYSTPSSLADPSLPVTSQNTLSTAPVLQTVVPSNDSSFV